MSILFTDRAARRLAARRRPAYTLVELVVAVAVTGILLAGMGSAIFVASRASDSGTVPSNTVEGSRAVAEIAAELREATSFSERTATSVAFTVADRNSDAAPETIRYGWSGTPGDPLTRQYNAGTVVEILEEVYEFQLGYPLMTITEEGPPTEAISRYFLTRVDVAIQLGDSSVSRIHTAVQILNAPEVTGP